MPSIHHLLDEPDKYRSTRSVRRPYDPVRKTPAASVTVPISRIELVQSQGSANPLRVGPAVSEPIESAISQPSGQDAAQLSDTPVAASRKRGREEDDNNSALLARKRRGVDHGDKAAVASHYNARPDIGISARQESPIIGLKTFNNWIKTVLIAKFGRREGSNGPLIKVLDLGCGKGGDLQKWGRAGTAEYVGIDLAASQTGLRSEETAYRANEEPQTSIEEVLDPAIMAQPFDVVSMQFCMHYAFETKEKAHMMLRNVSRFLRPGGHFIGTIPDAENLLARLEAVKDSDNLAFGNSVYGIKFDHCVWDSPFGHRYTFFLQDAVEEVPEYVVYWDEFVQLAEKYDLELAYCSDFQQLFAAERQDPQFQALLQRMKVVNAQGETDMTIDQWEAATLYLGFAFTKK
ncbi:mRNA cap guanine-N7 methyltransferase [Microbotryomycetes sp. JL201]|nr:mRNA cap guanine-N7 methyltransferase [Microbotryomycetes sp. JL201]